jgi:hypothetical protein
MHVCNVDTTHEVVWPPNGGSKRVVRVLQSRQRIEPSKGREQEQAERASADASSKPMMNDILLSVVLSKPEAAAPVLLQTHFVQPHPACILSQQALPARVAQMHLPQDHGCNANNAISLHAR